MAGTTTVVKSPPPRSNKGMGQYTRAYLCWGPTRQATLEPRREKKEVIVALPFPGFLPTRTQFQKSGTEPKPEVNHVRSLIIQLLSMRRRVQSV